MNQICVRTCIQPLVLDHLQKVPVVHDPVKNRAQREPIVPTERGRETDDGYAVVGDRNDAWVVISVFSTFDNTWTLDA